MSNPHFILAIHEIFLIEINALESLLTVGDTKHFFHVCNS